MYKLFSITELCKECGNCEALLPGFDTEHNKNLYISKRRSDEEEIRSAAERLVLGCPNDAIRFREA